jgi:hypothetical protein
VKKKGALVGKAIRYRSHSRLINEPTASKSMLFFFNLLFPSVSLVTRRIAGYWQMLLLLSTEESSFLPKAIKIAKKDGKEMKVYVISREQITS